MTPIEELRKGLDERGVRHMDFTKCGTGMAYPKYEPDRTHWSAHGGAFKFTSQEVDGILYVKTSGSNKWVEMTPEQAIAVTVGAGTCGCTVETSNDYYDDYTRYHMSCGFTMYSDEIEKPRFCSGCGRRVVTE